MLPEAVVNEGELTDLIQLDDASYLAVGGIKLSDYSTRGIAVRLNEDGSVQSDWGEGGYHWGHGLRQAQASVIKQLDDGSFIAAGYQNINGNLGQDIPALAKFHPDGSLDRSFAFRGHLTKKLDSKHNRPIDVEVLPDGKIMLMGRHDLNEGWLLGRFYADGRMDSTFDKDGWRIGEIDCFGCQSYPKNWRIDNDGNMLMAVAFFKAGESREDPALVRLTPEGQLDASFGEQGVVVIEETFFHHGFNDVEILSDGRILAAGFLYESGGVSSWQQSGFMARFAATGQLDDSFGDQGIVLWETQDWFTRILQIRQLSSGNILLAGEVQEEDDQNMRRITLWQISMDGALDPDFGENGSVEVDFPNSRKHEFYSFELDGEGNILVFGSGIASGHKTFIARFDATGQQDTDVGNNGLYIPEEFAMYPRGVPPLLLSDNRLVLPALKPATLNFSFACIDLFPNMIDTTTQQPSDSSNVQGPETFSIFPNPAKDEVNITVPESFSQTANTLCLIDLTGKIWLNIELDTVDQEEINISPLPKGLYIMMLKNNQDSYLQRFVKI
ncbi:MAG: T9SS type A sorting domain-containing protein [Bacteroidota bacterium]